MKRNLTKFSLSTLTLALSLTLTACSGGKSSHIIDPNAGAPKPRAKMQEPTPAPQAPSTQKAPSENPKADQLEKSQPQNANRQNADEKKAPYSGAPKLDDPNDIVNKLFGGGNSLSISNMFSDDNREEAESTEETRDDEHPNAFSEHKVPKVEETVHDEDDALPEPSAPIAPHDQPAPTFSATPIDNNVFGGVNEVMASTLTRTMLDGAFKGAELGNTPDNKLTLELDDQTVTLDLERAPTEADRKLAKTRWSPISLDNGIYLSTNDALSANSLASHFAVKFGVVGDIFNEDIRQFYVQGQATPISEMPVKDVVHYRGGAVVDQAGSVLSSAINADVDFANKQIIFDLASGKNTFGQTSPALQFKAEIAQNHFAGKHNHVQTQGAFYGKQASELAGVFVKEATLDSEHTDYNQTVRGVFGLKQSAHNQ